MAKLKIEIGKPIFGPKFMDGGVNFGLFSRNASKVILELYENFYDEKPFFSYELDKEDNKTGDIWHVYIKNIKDRTYYGWRVDGEYNPKIGKKFNKNNFLLIHIQLLYQELTILANIKYMDMINQLKTI